jgi:hypothetical protein
MKRLLCLSACLLPAWAALAAPAPEPLLKAWGDPVNPGKDCKITRSTDTICIEMPGTDHDYDAWRKQFNAPRLLRVIEGEFDLWVRVQIDCRHSGRSNVKGQPSLVSAGFLLLFPETYRTVCNRFEYGITQKGTGVDEFAVDNQFPADHQVPGNEAKGESQKINGEDGYAAAKVWFANGGQKPDMTWDRSLLGAVRKARGREWKNWPLPKELGPVYLRLERRRDLEFRFSISPDGDKWTLIEQSFIASSAKLKVGLAAYTTSTEPSKVRFDQIKLNQGKKKAK